MALEKLRESLRESPVIKRGEYNYFINPLTDGIPRLEADILKDVTDEIKKVVDLGDIDLIVTIESMGIHIAAALSLASGLPVNMVRKKQYWLPGEVVLDQSTGYSKGKLYVNDVPKGTRVIVVDAIVSTGGTLVAVLNGLKKVGAVVKDVVCVLERGDGVNRVKEETGFDVKTLVKVDVTPDGVVVN